MKQIEQTIVDHTDIDEAAFVEESKDYASYLHNSVYLVKKNELRGSISIGNAFLKGAHERIVTVLSYSQSTKEQAKKITENICTYLSMTFHEDTKCCGFENYKHPYDTPHKFEHTSEE